ncbi:MAG: hypothetical protein L4877_03210 [Aigarchaeota archaeon]|nr:hypothetical protein [Candidatus Geocrenenecus dongiae]
MPIGSLMTETVLAVTAIVIASMLAGVFLSTMNQVADIQKQQLAKFKEEVQYSCKIIYVYQDNLDKLWIWIKNTGSRSMSLQLVELSEIFLTSSSNVIHIPYNSGDINWIYRLKNDANSNLKWDPTKTLEIIVNLNNKLDLGDYSVKFVLFNGRSCEYVFSVD